MMICKKCGKEIEETVSVCPHCNEPVVQEVAAAPEKTPFMDSKMKKQSLILAVVCVAAIVCCFVFNLK